jgi:hypothetical protein
MAAGKERLAEGREKSLIFKSPEEAGEFVGRVEKRVSQEAKQGVSRKREIVGEELKDEIERQGEEAVDLSQPWEHSLDEHQEVQALVEVAFREDLLLALRKARKSDNYPRIIDLFHDVLTGQMYEALIRAGMNKQKMGKWQWGIVGLVVFLLVAALLAVILA